MAAEYTDVGKQYQDQKAKRGQRTFSEMAESTEELQFTRSSAEEDQLSNEE